LSDKLITPYSNRCAILSELWMEYRDDETFAELLEYGDLAFPLAFAVHEGVADSNTLIQEYIDEVWELLLAKLELEDSGAFEQLEDLF
jgi:hypothetical protein